MRAKFHLKYDSVLKEGNSKIILRLWFHQSLRYQNFGYHTEAVQRYQS